MQQRCFVDVAHPIDARRQDRRFDGQPRYDRVRHRAFTPGLHDLQLANACRSRASSGQGVARSRSRRAAHDFSAFVLVDGLRIVRLRQSFNCSGKAVARIGIWRSAWHSCRVRLRLFDVSGVPALGRAAEKQNRRGRTYACILVAPVCLALVSRHFAGSRFGTWSDEGEH